MKVPNGFPKTIYEIGDSAMFLAAFVAEPSRHTVAHISHLLATENPEEDWEEKKAFKGDGQLSMADGGTNPSQEVMERKGTEVDPRLDHGDKKIPKKVTDKDIAAVTNNKQLNERLYNFYAKKASQLPKAEPVILKKYDQTILKELKVIP